MKNLILISSGEPEQFDSVEELKDFLIHNYKEMQQDEIEKELYEKVFGISVFNDLQIVHSQKGVFGDDYIITSKKIENQKAIYIDSIETYLISLCKFNLITLLEEKENRVFTQNLKVEIEEKNNYVVVNAYADKILNMMVGDSYVS